MERPKIQAKKRTILGRKVKKLRREGLLPANLYGNKVKSQALEIPIKEFQKVYDQVGESSLVDLMVDGEAKPTLIHNVQLHPVTDEPLHADFHQVSLTEKTTATVPIELIGESPAVEAKIGILIQPISEIEVEALPQDLPERLTVDISKLAQVDDAMTVAEINIDKTKVEIKANLEEVVVKIEPLAKEEVVAPPPPTEGEEVIAEGPLAEGEEAPVAPTETAGGKAPAERKPASEEPKEK